ncbi:MAG: hypothetical protein IPL32_18955 [Chloracidobacterium sp.]|nr:hypothetical protein [Chloracidobacterium sp.]
MQTKVSPLLSNGITALITAFLAVGATVGVMTVTTATITTGTITTLAAGTVAIGGGTAVDFTKIQSSTIDAASIGPGSGTSSAVAFTGAALGDNVDVGLTGNWAAPSSSVVVTASVTAADVVTILFQNTSGTAVNLTSAAYSVKVTSP